MSRIRADVISALRSTSIVLFSRSSARWHVLPDWSTTIRLRQSSDKLDTLLAQTSTSKQDAALLAELLSLPNDGRYPALDLAPQQRRQKTLEPISKLRVIADGL